MSEANDIFCENFFSWMFPPHMTDFYKVGHIRQYPEGTTRVYSNMTPRSDHHFAGLDDYDHKYVNFGTQAVCQWLLIDMWNAGFFAQNRDKVIAKYKRRMDKGLGVGTVDPKHIGELHELGYMPLRIKALPEGVRVPMRVPAFTITNTHDKFFWLTNYIETPFSAEWWKPATNATLTGEYHRLMHRYGRLTGVDPAMIDYQAHGFEYRGMSGNMDAAFNAMPHLLYFRGTDTIPGIDAVEYFYGAPEDEMIGVSVPATEHSVMCMGGQDNEIDTFKRLINDIYPNGIVSIVSDTWDFWNVVTVIAQRLKQDIMKRDGKVVFRPDSGKPALIICGDANAVQELPAFRGAIKCLWDIFGGQMLQGRDEARGRQFKLLDSHVGAIYGDSITLAIAEAIFKGLYEKGFASINIIDGVGSFSRQYHTRDTLGTAMKATWGVVNGVPRELFKAPKTDNGVKNSARGLLSVHKNDGEYKLYEMQTQEEEAQGELRTIFEDSKMVLKDDWLTIRNRIHN